MPRLKPIEWTGTDVVIVDQTVLPGALRYETVETPEQMFDAIRRLKVRGAPLIGVSAAFGVYLGMKQLGVSAGGAEAVFRARQTADYLATSRPTAVNLFWALDRVKRRVAGMESVSGQQVTQAVLDEACAILKEDRAMCRAIGEHGFEELRRFDVLHTHCNAGGLATSDMGTALAPVYVGLERGKTFHVIVDETRPLLQGSRITAFELMQAGVPITLICDNMAASVMKRRKVDAVIVGADRIAANGDAANKIGTYGLALIARAHGVPFYVAAPSSTIDPSLCDGSLIPIEERSEDEVTCGMGRRTAPEGVVVHNPAFDVTPAELIAGIITERGFFRAPYDFSRV
jgi:methylthioribose-1-phosphate isomerase